MVGRVLLRPKRDVAGRVLLRPKGDVAGRVLLRPKRDVAGRVLLGPKRDVAGRVLLGPERDVAGRLLLRPKRDVTGRVGGRDESSWPGAELVGRGSEERERDERTALWDGCAGGKSKRERRCRESPKNKGVPKHRCGVLAQ